MEREDVFDFKNRYKDISEKNIALIQRYYNSKVKNIQSDSGIRRAVFALKSLCNMLNEDVAPDFDKWNADDIDYYIRESGYKSDNLRVLINVIQELMEMSGNRTDISHINNLTFLKEYSSSIYTFSDLNTSLQTAYQEINPHIEWKCVNAWSTTIVICYLLWLGFQRKEIAALKNTDYNKEAATIILNKGDKVKRRQIFEQPIIEYIERYILAKDYYVYNNFHKTRTVLFMDTDLLIKTTFSHKSSALTIVDNHRKKIHNDFGYTIDEILDAGRMNRLYFLDTFQGLSIDRSNAKVISEELDVPLAQRLDGSKSELGYLINLYPSYKEKREAVSKK